MNSAFPCLAIRGGFHLMIGASDRRGDETWRQWVGVEWFIGPFREFLSLFLTSSQGSWIRFDWRGLSIVVLYILLHIKETCFFLMSHISHSKSVCDRMEAHQWGWGLLQEWQPWSPGIWRKWKSGRWEEHSISSFVAKSHGILIQVPLFGALSSYLLFKFF